MLSIYYLYFIYILCIYYLMPKVSGRQNHGIPVGREINALFFYDPDSEFTVATSNHEGSIMCRIPELY